MGEWALIGNSIVIVCDSCDSTNVFPMTEDKHLACQSCGAGIRIDFGQQYEKVVESKPKRKPQESPYWCDGGGSFGRMDESFYTV